MALTKIGSNALKDSTKTVLSESFADLSAISGSYLGQAVVSSSAQMATDISGSVVGGINVTGNIIGSVTTTASFGSAHFRGTGGVGIGSNNPGTYNDGGANWLTIVNGAGRTGISIVGDAATDEPIGALAFQNEDHGNTAGRGGPRILGMRGANDNSGYLRFDTAHGGDSSEVIMLSGSHLHFPDDTGIVLGSGFDNRIGLLAGENDGAINLGTTQGQVTGEGRINWHIGNGGNNTNINIAGGENDKAILYFYADEGDDSSDIWSFEAYNSDIMYLFSE